MNYFSPILLIFLTGTLDARRADLDLNRLKLLPHEPKQDTAPFNSHNRRSVNIPAPFNRQNADDDQNRSSDPPQTPYRVLELPSTETDLTHKIYEPKEEPRLFYQSDAYLQGSRPSKDFRHEVSEIYPGRDVIRGHRRNGDGRNLMDNRRNSGRGSIRNICIKCPAELTLIAKPGMDRVILQKPRLMTCSGRNAPRSVHFVRMYGPNFGSLLEKGPHTIVAKVVHKGQVLQICKMQVYVLTQTCSVPKYLNARCDGYTKMCNFTCKDSGRELQGSSAVLCGDDMRWKEKLPVCKARTWCEYPPPPAHGRLSCIGASAGQNRLAEGARCKARCPRGWRWTPRTASICRRGSWTVPLSCQPRRTSPPSQNITTQGNSPY